MTGMLPLSEALENWRSEPHRTCPLCQRPTSLESVHPLCALDPAAAESHRPSGSACLNCRQVTPPDGWKTCTRCFFFPDKFRAPEVS